MEYTVKKDHWGDKAGKRHRFKRGETRIVEPQEVAAYVKYGALELADIKQKDGE